MKIDRGTWWTLAGVVAVLLALVAIGLAGCGSVSPTTGVDGGAGGRGGAGGAAGDVGGRGGAGGAAGDVGGRGGASSGVDAGCVANPGMTACRDGGACGLVHNGSSLPYCSTCRCANGVVGSGCCQCLNYVDGGTFELPCCDQTCQ